MIPTILIDQQEKIPYTFSTINPSPKTETCHLKTGDYSLAGFEKTGIAIERKTPIDLFGSMGNGRKRLEREFQRMTEFQYAVLMIEDDWINILKNPPAYSRMNKLSVWRTCLSWSVKYDVHVVWGHHRRIAERLVLRLLEIFYKNRNIIKERQFSTLPLPGMVRVSTPAMVDNNVSEIRDNPGYRAIIITDDWINQDKDFRTWITERSVIDGIHFIWGHRWEHSERIRGILLENLRESRLKRKKNG